MWGWAGPSWGESFKHGNSRSLPDDARLFGVDESKMAARTKGYSILEVVAAPEAHPLDVVCLYPQIAGIAAGILATMVITFDDLAKATVAWKCRKVNGP